MKFNKKNKNDFGVDWLRQSLYTTAEKKINDYITLRLQNGRTYIYVNEKRFIQCIRLILNISKEDVPIYVDVDSIDEAASLYNKHVFQNRIVTGPMARPVQDQRHDITPEQEFWGHCSNIQAWVEHGYDTRILMRNIAFPLLRELARAGDPKANKVFKEEIALRLESGFPSVVQYLINQGYIAFFTPFEFKTILETTDLIKGISSNPKMSSRFLLSSINKFPSLAEDILLQFLKLPEGKNIIMASLKISGIPRVHFISESYRSNYPYLAHLKNALQNLIGRVDEGMVRAIKRCLNEIELKINRQEITPSSIARRRLEILEKMRLKGLVGEEKAIIQKFFLEEIMNRQFQGPSKCAYCGKVIPKGQDTCDWCGHKKDDDERFFPYPFIYKPPGGGGGSLKGSAAVPIKIELVS